MRKMVISALILALSSISLSVRLAAGATLRSLTTVSLPADAVAADAVYDPTGTLHAVIVRKEGCLYASRSQGHETFAHARAVPATDPVQAGGERRPRLFIDATGRLLVIYQTRRGLSLATSTDQGQSWTPSASAVPTAHTGADVFNTALGPDGTLYIVWAGERDPKLPDDQVAQHLYLASTSDGGKTFAGPQAITTDAARACPCCVPGITCGKPGEVWIAYRSSVANVKETRVIHSTDTGRTFTAKQLSDHRWFKEGCPMAGPSIAVAGPTVVVSWTSDGSMYTAASADAGQTYSAPERLGQGRFNQVAASPAGQILQVWDEGHQTGLWWREDSRPAPRVDIQPGGVLVPAPDGRFELVGAPAVAGHPAGHHAH